MSPFPQVLQFLVVAVAGWINQQQRDVIDSLQEENRVRREQLGPADVTPLRRPARSPNLNASTARFVRTIKDSCLERLVLIGEGARRRAVREFVDQDHHERNPQGLDNRLILPLSTAPPPRGRVPCRQQRGGMLHYDSRSAA